MPPERLLPAADQMPGHQQVDPAAVGPMASQVMSRLPMPAVSTGPRGRSSASSEARHAACCEKGWLSSSMVA